MTAIEGDAAGRPLKNRNTKMRNVCVLAVLVAALIPRVAAAANDDPAIVACEELIKATIKTPKSYERVNSVVDGDSVLITYDAVNVYNAPIRSYKTCYFDLGKSGLTFGSEEMREIQRRLDDICGQQIKSLEAIRSDKDMLRAEVARIEVDIEAAHREFIEAFRVSMYENLIGDRLGVIPIQPSATQVTARAEPTNTSPCLPDKPK